MAEIEIIKNKVGIETIISIKREKSISTGTEIFFFRKGINLNGIAKIFPISKTIIIIKRENNT